MKTKETKPGKQPTVQLFLKSSNIVKVIQYVTSSLNSKELFQNYVSSVNFLEPSSDCRIIKSKER